MSADQRTLESLQCHFTWDLDRTRSELLLFRDQLEDMGSEEGSRWLGHIYNLRGFIQYKLGLHEDAQRFFIQAAEAFHGMRHADQGPWLVVNYGNLAWLHHHLGDQEQSQAYLSKVDALMEEYPSPSQGELHPEVCAEKAWTLMYFRGDLELAAGLFERAARMQPDMVEWNSSHVLSLVRAQRRRETGVTPDLFERMRQAKDQDPENLYLAVLYLEQRAKRGDRVEDEAREIARNILENLSRSYQALEVLLWVYKHQDSVDEAIELAEEALEIQPDHRYLKKCAALCYRWKIVFLRDHRPSPDIIRRAVSLQEDVVSLYLDSPFMKKLNLASLCAKSGPHRAKAKRIFQELFRTELTPADKQILYKFYANYLYYDQGDHSGSIRYHMKAAEIPEQTSNRRASIKVLKKTKDRGQHPMCPQIEEFLENLQEPGAENEDDSTSGHEP